MTYTPVKLEDLFLNRSEAAHLLHTLYEEFLAENDEIENTHPDFHSVLCENLREPRSASAVKAMSQRGNRGQYGKIKHVRFGNRTKFSVIALMDWFDTSYAPKLILAA